MNGKHTRTNSGSGVSLSANGNIASYEISNAISLTAAMDDRDLAPGYIFNNSTEVGYATLMLSDSNVYLDYILAPGPNPIRVKKVTATSAESKSPAIAIEDLKIVY